MSPRAKAMRIGIFVVGAIGIAVAAIVAIGSGKWFEVRYPRVLYFDGSVNGLRPGAPVKFKGVEIGQVRSIRLPAAQGSDDPPIEVVIELDATRIEPLGALYGAAPEALERGLRARLDSDSFVTGLLFIAFVSAPDTPVRLRGLRTDMIEIPTIPTPLERIEDAARRILAQIESIDIRATARDLGVVASRMRELFESDEMEATLHDVRDLARELREAATGLDVKLTTIAARIDSVGAGMEQSVAEARLTIAAARELIEGVDERGTPLIASLTASAEGLVRVITALETTAARASGLVDPDAPIAVGLRDALREVQDAARATRELIELLERNPSALLRGKHSGDG